MPLFSSIRSSGEQPSFSVSPSAERSTPLRDMLSMLVTPQARQRNGAMNLLAATHDEPTAEQPEALAPPPDSQADAAAQQPQPPSVEEDPAVHDAAGVDAEGAAEDLPPQPTIVRDDSSEWSVSNFRRLRYPAMSYSSFAALLNGQDDDLDAGDCTPEASGSGRRRLRPASLGSLGSPGVDRGAEAAWSPSASELGFFTGTPRADDSEEGLPWHQYLLRPLRLVRAMASPTAPDGLRYCATVQRPGASPSATPLARQPLPEGKESVCAICLEPFELGEPVQPMVGCDHLFHRCCIEDHIQTRCENCPIDAPLDSAVSCPLCRGPVLAKRVGQLPAEEGELAQKLAVEEELQEDDVGTPASTSTVTFLSIGRRFFRYL